MFEVKALHTWDFDIPLEVMTMTFEQFQTTRQLCDDLGDALADTRWEGGPKATGFLYLGALYIEDVADHWPEGTTPHPTAGRDRVGFQLATFSRFLFSALVDSDWSDTGIFYRGAAADRDQPWPVADGLHARSQRDRNITNAST
jgi:hypothetical protein